MVKFIIVLCAFIACASAKPHFAAAPLAYSAPLAAAPFAAPLAYTAPLAAPVAYAAAPLAYANAHLDAAYAAHSVDLRQNYNAAVVPTTFAAIAPAKFVAPATYTAVAPLGTQFAAPVGPAVAPLKYTSAVAAPAWL